MQQSRFLPGNPTFEFLLLRIHVVNELEGPIDDSYQVQQISELHANCPIKCTNHTLEPDYGMAGGRFSNPLEGLEQKKEGGGFRKYLEF